MNGPFACGVGVAVGFLVGLGVVLATVALALGAGVEVGFLVGVGVGDI
ncbi:MAG: hypothetical protein ACXV3E_05545 [Halobacteriota archaeon]